MANKGTKRICRDCGMEFLGGPLALFCENCRKRRAAIANKKCKARKLAGEAAQVGITERKCKICGTSFIISGTRQIYCKACAEEMRKALRRKEIVRGSERICEGCGSSLLAYSPLTRFCAGCKAERKRETQRIYREKNRELLNEKRKENYHKQSREKPPIEKVCLKCGETFTARGNQKYCNNCKNLNKKLRKSTLGREAICKGCGKPCVFYKRNQKYCEDCRKERYTNGYPAARIVNESVLKRHDKLMVYVPKGMKAQIKAAAAAEGISMIKYVRNALEKKLKIP